MNKNNCANFVGFGLDFLTISSRHPSVLLHFLGLQVKYMSPTNIAVRSV